jgi:hypothetical protein
MVEFGENATQYTRIDFKNSRTLTKFSLKRPRKRSCAWPVCVLCDFCGLKILPQRSQRRGMLEKIGFFLLSRKT